MEGGTKERTKEIGLMEMGGDEGPSRHSFVLPGVVLCFCVVRCTSYAVRCVVQTWVLVTWIIEAARVSVRSNRLAENHLVGWGNLLT